MRSRWRRGSKGCSMRTTFYSGTAYLAAQLTVPPCFVELDTFYEPILPDIPTGYRSFHLRHAENICRRMSDIDLYAWFISDAKTHSDPIWAATIIGSYLVGFFSACKSLFDAGSITLNDLHSLKLANRQQDMSKGSFWTALQRSSLRSFARFNGFRPICNEVVQWRDASVHRATPLVVVHSPGPPDSAPPEAIRIRMVADPNARLERLIDTPNDVLWLDPLQLYDTWRPNLESFCGALCTEIQEALQSQLVGA